MRDNILIRVDEHRDIDDGALIEKTYSVVLYRNPGAGEKPLAYLYSSDNPDMARGVREYLITRMPLDNLMDIIDDLPTRLPGEDVKGKTNEGGDPTWYKSVIEELKREVKSHDKLRDENERKRKRYDGKYKAAFLDQAKRTINLIEAIQLFINTFEFGCPSEIEKAIEDLRKAVHTK